MDIHEYQAKEIFRSAGIPVPPGEVATTPEEAERIAHELGGTVVVKAQVHAGGRGKAGGVKLAKSADEAERIARDMIGMTLKTHQTGPEGRLVSRVFIEQGLGIDRELYLALILDRAAARPILMASPGPKQPITMTRPGPGKRWRMIRPGRSWPSRFEPARLNPGKKQR